MRTLGLLSAAVFAWACGGGGAGGFSPAPGVPSALKSPLDVWVFSPTNVWIVDGSATVHRFDGSSWSTMATPAKGGLTCIFALSTSDVWLCGGDQILHHDGMTFTAGDVTPTTGLDGISSIWASSPTDVWAVGDDAIVVRGNGTTWSRTIVGSPFKSSIWGSGPTDVYALSTFDLSHFDGMKWSDVELDNGAGDGEIFGTSRADIWVATGDEHPSHFDGVAWKGSDLDIVGDLQVIWGPAPDDLWAAGSAGSILHYDGHAWSELTHQTIGAPYLRQWTAIHGSASGEIWLVGRQLGSGGATGLIYRRGG